MKLVEITFSCLTVDELEYQTKRLECLKVWGFVVYNLLNMFYFVHVVVDSIMQEQIGEWDASLHNVSFVVAWVIFLMDLVMIFNLLSLSKVLLDILQVGTKWTTVARVYINVMCLVLFGSMFYKPVYSYFYIIDHQDSSSDINEKRLFLRKLLSYIAIFMYQQPYFIGFFIITIFYIFSQDSDNESSQYFSDL